MKFLSETTHAFLKWRKCKIEEEEIYDMLLMEDTKKISDIDRKKMRMEMINIYDKKCKKLYKEYRQICFKGNY